MRCLLFVFFGLFTFFSWTQNEKGCTIRGELLVYYGEENPSVQLHFYEIWPGSSTEFSTKDTFAITVDSENDILIKWSFFNELSTVLNPHYDTVQWYFNDTLMEPDNYTFISENYSATCGTAYRAESLINQVKPGYYQLRLLGRDSILDTTSFPVIQVYEKVEANLTEEDTPTENTTIETLLYPNPAKNLVNLKLSKPINKGVMLINNLQGQLVLSYPLNNIETVTHYDISQLNQGLYLFSVIDSEKGEEILRKKMVVQ